MLKGFHITRRAMVALSWLLLGSHSALLSASEVVFVLSSDNSYYQQTISTIKELDQNAHRYTSIILSDDDSSPPVFSDADKTIITFGSKAASQISEQTQSDQLILSYLTGEQYQQLAIASPHTVALLDQPLQRYLDFANALVSGGKVGTLLTPRAELDLSQQGETSPTLQWLVPEDPGKILLSLRDLLNDIDVFLMTPNLSLYNRSSLRGILLTTYRADKPVISFSPAHVRSGAIGSIYSSPEDIGKHLFDLLEKKSASASTDDDGNRVEYARYFSITTNRKVARSLGIELPADEEIINQIPGDLR